MLSIAPDGLGEHQEGGPRTRILLFLLVLSLCLIGGGRFEGVETWLLGVGTSVGRAVGLGFLSFCLTHLVL